ncbi:hypothetical protein [Rhodococcus globerulus]|uniref:hypothetical protein n=1 Tax=Rhodococcus globerulus TaxID=33008 RepID=UPI000527E59A|nr:hypothetical protein [Rhodococcus globerulus]PVX59508.1 hypothetical protein C8E04_6071 [Rhodococcus globerulus]
MDDLWPLLVEDQLEGVKAVERQLHPPSAALAVDRSDLSAATAAVVKLCSSWGGGSMPIIPVTAGDAVIAPSWARILLESPINGISGPLPQTEIDKYSDTHGGYRQGLLPILTGINDLNSVVTSRGISPDDPWYVAYLGVFGDLPAHADSDANRRHRLVDTLTYDEVLTVKEAEGEPGAESILTALRDMKSVTAVELTFVKLAQSQASFNKGFPSTSRFKWGDLVAAGKFGPNLVVVYRPGSVDDLALLWTLRARFGHPDGFPLAVPYIDSAGAALDHWTDEHAAHYFGMDHNVGLTSISVDTDALNELATGRGFSVVSPEDVLRPIPGCSVPSTEMVHFIGGKSTVPSVSSTEIDALGQHILGVTHSWTKLSVTVTDRRLPFSRTMRRDRFANGGYLGGYLTGGGRRGEFATVFHPSGLEVLQALFLDHGLDARPSVPGRAAEQLMRAVGGDLDMIASPAVTDAFQQLTRGRSSSVIKRRLGQFLQADKEEQKGDRYQILADRLDAALGTPDSGEIGYKSLTQLQQLMKLKGLETQRWVEWAVRQGLLLRGVEASCSQCTHKQWRPFADTVPALVCHGCGQEIPNPHGNRAIEYKYRAAETLLRAVNDDVLPCILSARHISSVFGPDRGHVFGIYPGIELRELGDATVFAEIDVVVVLSNGNFIFGECKVNARGLTDGELAKLWEAADRVGATATFAATMQPATECGDVWKITEDAKGRPHFALTAEHLYELFPSGPALGEEWFAWRDKYSVPQWVENAGTEDSVRSQFAEYLLRIGGDPHRWRRAPWTASSD